MPPTLLTVPFTVPVSDWEAATGSERDRAISGTDPPDPWRLGFRATGRTLTPTLSADSPEASTCRRPSIPAWRASRRRKTRFWRMPGGRIARRWQQPLPAADPRPDPTQRPAMPSTAEGRRRSLQAQIQGDERLRRQAWGLAAERYRRAVETADDNAANHIRLGVALAAQNQLELASREFRRAVFVDRQIAQTAPRLTELLGPDGALIRLSLISRLTSWVEEDIRDPDRLWVLGVMLHLNDDPRAAEILEAGYRLAGGGDHFLAFVSPAPVAGRPGLPAAPSPPAGLGPRVIEIRPPGGQIAEPPPQPGIVPEAELPPAPAPVLPAPAAGIPQPPNIDDLPPLPR